MLLLNTYDTLELKQTSKTDCRMLMSIYKKTYSKSFQSYFVIIVGVAVVVVDFVVVTGAVVVVVVVVHI